MKNSSKFLVEANPEKIEQLYKEILTTLHEQAVYVPFNLSISNSSLQR